MPQINMQQLSPMMRQYFDIKNAHEGHIVFFRLGDFYEMFFDDAILAAKELELTLTGRDCGLDERAPMCGVPHHSCETYIARLIKKGYKVAICEQTETPSEAKGIVRREVVRVVTPGTIIESNLLDEGINNYISCIYLDPEGGYGLAFADISTGEIKLTQIEKGGDLQLQSELGRFYPSEIIFNAAFLNKNKVADFIKNKLSCVADLARDNAFELAAAQKNCTAHFGVQAMEELGIDSPLIICCLGGLLDYLQQTQRGGLERLISVDLYAENQYINLPLTSRRNLEITQTMMDGGKKGTLLWVLDKTATAMGRRLLRSWLEQPLKNIALIHKRLGAVQELASNHPQLCDITQMLAGVYDIERLMTKVVYGNASPRDVKALGFTFEKLPALKDSLSGFTSTMLRDLYTETDPMHEVCALISRAISDKPPIAMKDGGVINDGYSPELDQCRDLCQNTQKFIAQIEQDERAATGIKSLKVSYNRVFGYYIEITKSYLSQVPEHYVRRQTLAGAERFVTQPLKALEEQMLTASERLLTLEQQLFDGVRSKVAAKLHQIQRTAKAVAQLDVLASFATVANQNNYTCPTVDLSDALCIKDGRHPVVEQLVKGAPFVPNDTILDNKENQIAIITGPNMAGKSTYMRQTALITLMAQVGSFVPASSATVGVVDGIFTRVGASDDLSSGQSTFMVEMSEVAAILAAATSKSLLILDEIGRGTSTFDGMSIARGVIEYIADKRKVGAKTLFATHYHELTELENHIPVVKNYNIAVKKRGDEITFLRRIVHGGADDSYGIEVSKLAGIPQWIITRAHEVLKGLEEGGQIARPSKAKAAPIEDNMQMSMGNPAGDRLTERLSRVDPNTLTAIEALNLIFELKSLL